MHLGREETSLIEDGDEVIFDGADIVAFLKLHAVEILAVVAKEHN